MPENPENDFCPLETCPGSSLYIYENMEDEIVCCMCALGSPDASQFVTKIETEMAKHILEHDQAGHHVRRSLLKWAREQV